MKNSFVIFLIMMAMAGASQNRINIVPMPAKVKAAGNNVAFTLPIQLVYDVKKSNLNNALYLQKALAKIKCPSILVANEKYDTSKGVVMLLNDETIKDKEAYELLISGKNRMSISGKPQGVFMGIQTLLQLIGQQNKNFNLNKLMLATCKINDHPRFAYRGMHLDVGRHFFPIPFIKKYIDYLAAYKYNTFHWHLTDDQGWRIEIKKYPLLTSVGGYRNGTIIGRYPGKGNDGKNYGGYYSQKEIKEIVQYASDRYITIIPEIELPGHSSAAIAAYPQLSCFPDEPTKTTGIPWAGTTSGKQVQQTWGVFEDVFCPTEFTFNFLQDVMDEVIQLFPSGYIHIGGDECPKEAWKRSVFCQQLIKDNNLKDEHGLQSYFIQRIEKYINGKGKKIIGWDEILEGGLAPNASVMSWRGEEGGIEAAKQNHDVIMTPGTYCYIDHSQSKNEDSVTIGGYLPLEKVYGYEPVPAALNAEQAKHILGAQGNVWTEYMEYPSKVEYMIFPRMLALSEVLWSPKENRNWKDFERRLPSLIEQLQKQKINYSAAYYDLKASVLPTENNEGVLYKLETNDKNLVIKYMDDANKAQMDLPQKDSTGKTINVLSDIYWGKGTTYKAPIPVTTSNTIFAETYQGKVQVSNTISQKFIFNKATGKKITLANTPNKSYPGDGAFTLVNGVQNENGLAKSSEFLGFLGNDLDATIDLKNTTDISKVTLHVLDQNGSWIYLPRQVEIIYIPNTDYQESDYKNFPVEIKHIDPIKEKGMNTITIKSKQQCRYLRIVAKNFGIIPAGNQGAGNPAWLFADEIEVE
jgi:hexosaminidase